MLTFIIVGILPSHKLDRWQCLPLSELLGLHVQEQQPDKLGTPSSVADRSFGFRSGGKTVMSKLARCIVDSGASDHIISRTHLTKQEMKSIRKADYVMTFQTANRTTQADDVVDCYVSDLSIYVTAWVLDDSLDFSK